MAGGRSMSLEHSRLGGSSVQRQHVQWQRAGSRLQRTDSGRPSRSASQREHSS